jgi:hypothetical protein
MSKNGTVYAGPSQEAYGKGALKQKAQGDTTWAHVVFYTLPCRTELLQGIYAFIHSLEARGLQSLVTERLLQAYEVARFISSPAL